ncbi:MAG: hypothetical protein CMF72_24675 [Mameliella sp.]|nr:hypothetical protein [Mameliella sp.]|tara:strand:- start:1956 stop:2183 length:228 start_codon:yes stop_codon:yes gene_type:complete
MNEDELDMPDPESPWIYVLGAVVLAAVAGFAAAQDAPVWVLYIAAGVVGLISTIGAVGVGVLIGIRRADLLRDKP